MVDAGSNDTAHVVVRGIGSFFAGGFKSVGGEVAVFNDDLDLFQALAAIFFPVIMLKYVKLVLVMVDGDDITIDLVKNLVNGRFGRRRLHLDILKICHRIVGYVPE